LTCAECQRAGDSARDLLAGAAAGCEPHLVLTGNGEAHRDRALPDAFPPTTIVHNDLGAFADFVIARSSAQSAESSSRKRHG
jgi:D-glycero-D-manno-heptose 1,7-bisphosphate phosphatase